MDEIIKKNRETLKPNWIDLYNVQSAKRKGLEKPEKFLNAPSKSTVISLVDIFPNIKQKDFSEVISLRRSLRTYKDLALTQEELSYLLWETSRVTKVTDNAVFRTIPTAGASNSMETYVYIDNVIGLEKGIYLYLQEVHKLALIKNDINLDEKVNEALLNQLRGAQVVVFFTCVPERIEYKYHFCAHKMIAIEAGHACQNISLAAEVINCGVCAICAYDQAKVDEILTLDGEEHFTVYCATIGNKH